MLLEILLVLFVLIQTINTHMSWTPIYLDASNQVDIWTVSSTGCPCASNASSTLCACCVSQGGCQCSGRGLVNKCVQCGMEQACSSACNMTITASSLVARSSLSYGQLKSPSVAGPGLCWYSFVPDSGQRVELQIYRLISVGKFNGTDCLGGQVTLSDVFNSSTTICGTNERFTPPVVLFVDRGSSRLTFQIQDSTTRSQFLAYFSFTPLNSSHPGVGFQPRGGQRVNNTACDWVYHDFSCIQEDACQFSSPGYPGLYPAHALCSYLITSSSQMSSIHVRFHAISFPVNHCGTDYITIHEGTSPTSPLMDTICSNQKQEFVYTSPKILIVFRSGSSIPPYDYNGFVASIRFTGITSTDTSIASARHSGGAAKPKDQSKLLPPPSVPPLMLTNSSATPIFTSKTGCEMTFFANMSRSGHFDSRSFQGHWSINCTLIFVGLETDVVHISLFNYVLKSPSCHTFIEFYDASKPIRKICSPSQKNINDQQKQHQQQGSNHQPLFTSTHSSMKISLIRAVHLVKENQDEEFIDGAYSFHDQRIYGTLQPDTLCNVKYYGLTSASTGTISNPGKHHLFWNIDHTLICSSRFIPRTNQSVVLSITSLGTLSSGDISCHTACGDTGCFCKPSPLTTHSEEEALASLDHLKLTNDDGEVVACLCGEFQQDWLPVSVRSWSPISLVYSVAHYTYTAQGFTHESKYDFMDDNLCGHHTLEQYSGLIQSSQSVQRSQDLNYYYNLQCTWLLNSKVKRSVYIEFYSEQNKPCASWNLTVARYKPSAPDRCGRVLHVFCPRDQVKLFNTNESVVILKLTAHTTLIPQYSVKYYSKLRDEMSDADRADDEGVIGLTSQQSAHDEIVQDMTSSVQDEPHPDLPSSVLASRNLATTLMPLSYFQWVLLMGVEVMTRTVVWG
uniref:CUB domain-containing protein n=1 Tax=Cacopsylla melanoneura TaxID=428564 RepID=A0A8D8ZX56_9HEMI